MSKRALPSSEREARHIWESLTRVVAATPASLKRHPPHVASLKLDGKRAALVRRDGLIYSVDAHSQQLLGEAPGPSFILDVEELAGEFWAFDVLFMERDLRALALADRLDALEKLLGGGMEVGGRRVRIKAYVPLRTPDALPRLLAEAARSEQCDGLIFCNLEQPYESPPLKYKPRLTVDVCFERRRGPPGTYALMAQQGARLRPFRTRGRPSEIFVGAAERLRLGLPEDPQGCVVECEVPRGSGWKAMKLRPDRLRPNCLRTVQDTVGLRQQGWDDPAFLLAHVACVSTEDAVRIARAVLRRRVLAAETAAASAAWRTVEVGGERGAVAGSEPPEALACLTDVLACASFSLDDAELRTAVEAARRASHVRLLVLLQTVRGVSAKDVGYFGPVNVLPAGAVPLDSEPSRLLELPAPLRAMIQGSVLLQVGEEHTPAAPALERPSVIWARRDETMCSTSPSGGQTALEA